MMRPCDSVYQGATACGNSRQVINEDDVAHVIKAIKSDAIGQVEDEHGPLEVIELPEPVKREQPAEHLEVIELNWAPRQSEYARRAGIHT